MELISGAGKSPCNLPVPQKTARTSIVAECTFCAGSSLEVVWPYNNRRFYYHCIGCHLSFDPFFHQFLQVRYPPNVSGTQNVNKVIDHADGRTIDATLGRIDFFKASGAQTAPRIKYDVTCHELVEKPDDLAAVELALKEKADGIFTYFLKIT